jgi:hypothetical protein
MKPSIPASNKRKGRPPTGKGEQVVVRMQPATLASLDAWIARQPEPWPSRPEAVRRILAEALARPIADRPQSVG